MKTLVIVVHPNLEQSKINKRWSEELLKHEDKITVNLLYQEYPNEDINVEREQQLLLEHDRIVLQFPFYWYSAPYLLQKWEEAVLVYGWAYGPGGTKLRGKDLVLAVSTGGPSASYQAGGYNNYSMSELLKPFQNMANLIGANYLTPFIFHGAVTATDEDIEKSATQYIKHILDPELDPKVALQNLLDKMKADGTVL
ncbi:MAG: NAD(P)H-dependent oxidoreductase [Syntrophomonadaceae bacterium]